MHQAPQPGTFAEVVLGALLHGRSVDPPHGRIYHRGTIPWHRGHRAGDENGCVVTRELPVGEFLRLSEDLAFNDLHLIRCDRVLAETAVQQRRARARLATAAQAA